ncbi:MAG: hydroxymyristoyl-ACP dehydratase [Acidobacteria bacterium]|nr:hydroxymyristoyl-ACP dehydratase [Acidobacteriota bacterium]
MTPYPSSLQAHPERAGTFTFRMEAEHPAYRGHFPGDPILPGVVQVEWALRLGEAAFGPFAAFQGLEHLKFQSTITPGETITLSLAWDAARNELAFEYADERGLKSKGFARFAARS